MALLDCEAQVEAHFDPFGDSAKCKISAWFGPYVPWPWKPFWTQLMGLLGDMGHLESRIGLFRYNVSVGAR
jgi:hypothetical protein